MSTIKTTKMHIYAFIMTFDPDVSESYAFYDGFDYRRITYCVTSPNAAELMSEFNNLSSDRARLFFKFVSFLWDAKKLLKEADRNRDTEGIIS